MAREKPEGQPPKPLTVSELLRRIARLSPEDQSRAKRAVVQQYAASTIVDRTPEAEALEKLGWEAWLGQLAPHVFKGTHAKFHREFWEWYWPLLIAKRDGHRLVKLDIPLSYLLTLGRGMGKCLEASTPVLRDDGTETAIRDIAIGDRVMSYDGVTGRSVVDTVTNKWHSGTKRCFKVRTKTNKTLTLTAEHRLWSFDGWRQLQDLKPGDRIAVPRRTRVPAKEMARSDAEIRLLAYMLAEGGTGGGYPNKRNWNNRSCSSVFTNADQILVQDFHQCAAAMGFEVKPNGNSKYGYRINGAQPWLKDVGMSQKRSWEKSLPSWVFSLPECQRWLFLGVFMDTDGYFDGAGGGHSGITLSSERMIQDLSALFLSVGVISRIAKKSEHKHGAWVLVLDHEGLKLCVEHLPLLLKAETLARLHTTSRYSLLDVYPYTIGRGLPYGKGYELQRAGVRMGKKAHPTVTRSKLRRAAALYPHPQWLWLEQADVFWDQIESIEPAGECDTYDIETKHFHNFIANGIVSHNSTSAEWAVIAMGAILGQVLVVYVSSTSKLAANHLNNIREEIEAAEISKYYPGLANPEVGKFSNRYGWKSDLLATRSGLTAFAVGLEEEVRGLKRKQHRPGLIILDEFDSKTDSPDVVRKKEQIIGGSIFGTQVEDTLIVMAQNLIHAQSVATRTLKRRNELISHRRESGVVKAFTDDLEIGMVGTRWVVLKGKTTWDYFDEHTFQKFLDSSGPIETYAEYQHEFGRDKEGKAFPNYIDKDATGFTHVITEEEFSRVFRDDRPSPSWNKYVFNDKARTKTEWHANVGGTLTMSGMNTPLPGVTFLYDCLSSEADTQPDDFAIEILKCMSPTVMADGQEWPWEELVRTIITRNNVGRFTTTLKEQINAQRQGLSRIIPKYVRQLITGQHYVRFRMSHEADDWRRVYRDTFGLPFEAANPAEGQGVDLVNFSMKVDYTVECPFGRTVINEAGLRVPVMGMARFYIIVKNDKRAYPDDNKPDLLHGSDLARFQLTEHRWLPPRLNAAGELERGLEKRNDDFTNGLQFFYYDNSIRARELTQEELAEALREPRLQLASIQEEQDSEKKMKMMMARQIVLKQELHKQIADQLGSRKAGNKLSDYRSLMRGR